MQCSLCCSNELEVATLHALASKLAACYPNKPHSRTTGRVHRDACRCPTKVLSVMQLLLVTDGHVESRRPGASSLRYLDHFKNHDTK